MDVIVFVTNLMMNPNFLSVIKILAFLSLDVVNLTPDIING